MVYHWVAVSMVTGHYWGTKCRQITRTGTIALLLCSMVQETDPYQEHYQRCLSSLFRRPFPLPVCWSCKRSNWRQGRSRNKVKDCLDGSGHTDTLNVEESGKVRGWGCSLLFSPLQSPLGCMYNMMAKDTCVGDHKVRVLLCIVAILYGLLCMVSMTAYWSHFIWTVMYDQYDSLLEPFYVGCYVWQYDSLLEPFYMETVM